LLLSNQTKQQKTDILKIILVGNYSKDNQVSMKRFLNVLELGLSKNNIEYVTWKPIVLLGFLFNRTNVGFGKWLAYIDKYIFTYIVFYIKVIVNEFKLNKTIYHICDHSNAVYINIFPFKKTVITCHDVLAIRGALGFRDAYCNSSGFGKMLQHFILKKLSKNIQIAFVSKNTLNQFKEIAKKLYNQNYKVIHNGLNADFKKLNWNEIENLKVKYSNFPSGNFILHVGSNLERKNRKLLVNMLFHLNNNYKGNICFAGEKPNEEIISLATQLNIKNRIYFIEKPNHELLNLLYNTCDAFIFPSFTEGFGWPVIEAQSCGAPVICSNIEPLPEIGGEGVLFANPNHADEFATQFLKLKDAAFKAQLIELGFKNVTVYNTNQMVNNYIDFYNTILK
jgi:glycosyltransferase involved in cell wall biosynthesis